MEYWRSSFLDLEREKLRQLFDLKWTVCDHKALKQTMSIHPIFLVDVQ